MLSIFGADVEASFENWVRDRGASCVLWGVLIKTCQRGAKIVRSLRFVICNFYLKSRFKNRGARFDLILFGIYSIYKIALNTLKYILKVTANH